MLENNVCLKFFLELRNIVLSKLEINYLGCNGDLQRQIESLKLSNVIFVGLLQAHAKTGADHLGEGTQGVDVGEAIEQGHLGVLLQLLLQNIYFLQELSALISLQNIQ